MGDPVVEFIWALIVALVVGTLFAFLFRRTGPWEGMIWFFIVLFFGTWAFGIWIEPIGPAAWGDVSLLPFVFAALFIALLVLAATPAEREDWRRRKSHEGVTDRPTEAGVRAVTAVNVFLWAVILVALIAIVANFLLRGG